MFNKFQHFVSSKRCGRRLCKSFSLPWWFWTRTETSAGPVSSRASDTGRDITATTRSVKNDLWYVQSILAFELCWPSAMNLWNTDMNNCPLVETVSHVLNFASYPRKQCWVKTLNHAHATSERDCLAGASIRPFGWATMVSEPWLRTHAFPVSEPCVFLLTILVPTQTF